MISDDDGFESDYSYSDDDLNVPWEGSNNVNDNTGQLNPKHSYRQPTRTEADFSGWTSAGIHMLPSHRLMEEMNRRVDDLTDVMGVPAASTAVLLRKHAWSKETILERYCNDSDTLWKECGVYNRCHRGGSWLLDDKVGHLKDQQHDPCPICYETPDQTLVMPCGHGFCVPCWEDFLKNAIEGGPWCIQTKCPEADCAEVVTEQEVSMVLRESHPLLLQKYRNYQLRSFVDSNRLTRWCPGKGCDMVACATSLAAMEQQDKLARCHNCRLQFCVECGEEPHAPCSCKHILMWKQKCQDESETTNWMLTHTKSCPKCHSRIEKNQGCHRMRCRNCQFQFCWLCMEDWTDHGYGFRCRGFTNEVQNPNSSKAKHELHRYLNCYQRYQSHAQAQDFAQNQLVEQTQERMESLQKRLAKNDDNWNDGGEFLAKANDQVVECRRVLKHTYIFAYYFCRSKSDGGNLSPASVDCFQYHQHMLERFTEVLSELSEKPVEEMEPAAVVNQTRAMATFVKNVLDYVEYGMDEN